MAIGVNPSLQWSLIDALAAADAAEDSGDLSLLPQTDDESVDPTVDDAAG